jgi:DNA-binding MarR family transcriptional regulator
MQLLLKATEGGPAEACAGTLLDALPGLMRFVRRQMRSRRSEGLSVPQFRTLVQVRRCPSAGLSSIAEVLGSSPPTVCRIVNGLVRKGYIRRQTSCSDRRCVTLQLTTRGRQAIDTAWAGTQQVLAARLSTLSGKQLVSMKTSLDALEGLFACGGEDPRDAD